MEEMTKMNTLFPNNNIHDNMFQTSKKWLDNHGDMAKVLDSSSILDKIEHSQKYGSALEGTVNSRKYYLKIDDMLSGGPPSDIYQIINKCIRSGIGLKYYLALWQLANKKGNRYINDVNVNEVIKLAKNKSTVRDKDRKELTEFLLAWNNDRQLTRERKRTPFKCKGETCYKVEYEIKFMKLFELDKMIANLQVDGAGKVIKKSNIKRITGAFPKELFETGKRKVLGAYLPKAIFQLSGDSKERIQLALMIWKSANNTKDLFKDKDDILDKLSAIKISWDRKTWISNAGIQKTDSHNKSVANDKLLATLLELQNKHIIDNCPCVLPTEDNEMITVTLPLLQNTNVLQQNTSSFVLVDNEGSKAC